MLVLSVEKQFQEAKSKKPRNAFRLFSWGFGVLSHLRSRFCMHGVFFLWGFVFLVNGAQSLAAQVLTFFFSLADSNGIHLCGGTFGNFGRIINLPA